ncbi:hypothetical protein ACI65C_005191 [Semiaphis heraclei]
MHYPVGYNRSLMIILLVAYIIRVGRCLPDDALLSISDATNTDTNTATNTDTNTATNTDTNTNNNPTTEAATDKSSPAQDSQPSMLSKCTKEVNKSISTLGDGLSLVMKAIGQAALTVIGTLFGTYNGLISVTAKTGETVAAGLSFVDNAASKVAVVNGVTGVANEVVTRFTKTFSENVEETSANRVKLFDELDKGLENYHPGSKPLPIAPSTNGGDKSPDTTVTETEQEVATPA